VLLICTAWRHVTCFWVWVKSGQVCWGVEVSISLFYHDICERSASRPSHFTIGKRSHRIFRRTLVEVTLVCETADAHKPPHVLGRVATTILVHVDVPEFHFTPLQLQFMLWQHSIDVCRSTFVVLWLFCYCSFFYALNLNALLLIVDARLWGSVQFLAQTRAVLWTHAFKLCTITLVFYNFIECCILLSVWGVFMVRKTNTMRTFLNN